ncbi:hypothetical protein E3A20_29540 [Planctomyces bekefii]|uniref:Uncharacterized protein n=1 Tax=Planctomyces bekefii TaxID=1653850 RepID=A0A5C6M0R9_9PLAN|nr:hypothetical protein E3A20_29540 [Planctomyces bekefii]
MAENQNVVGGYELKNCIASGSSTQVWEVVEQGGGDRASCDETAAAGFAEEC